MGHPGVSLGGFQDGGVTGSVARQVDGGRRSREGLSSGERTQGIDSAPSFVGLHSAGKNHLQSHGSRTPDSSLIWGPVMLAGWFEQEKVKQQYIYLYSLAQ